MEDASQATGAGFQRLVDIMARLRAPGGCPWDREQTFDSIKPYTLEETYEVLDAIDRRDWADLRDELGDFLLQAVFYAQMASEEKLFNIGESLDAINEKLIRRHPHIFADGDGARRKTTSKRWDEIKAKSGRGKRSRRRAAGYRASRAAGAGGSAADHFPRGRRSGFDWPQHPTRLLEKLDEELAEFEEAAARRIGRHHVSKTNWAICCSSIVNLARFVKVDPEQALRRTNAKFRSRFGYVERRLADTGRKVSETPIAEMEELWQEAKTAPEVRPEAVKTAAERNTGESKSKP